MKVSYKLILLGVLLVLNGFLRESKAQDKDEIKEYSVVLGGQYNREIGSFLNFSNGEVLPLYEASNQYKNMDLIYAYGKKTKMNLFVPKSNRIGGYGDYKEIVLGTWSVFNDGTLMNLRQDKKISKEYKKVGNKKELLQLYKEAKNKVKSISGYKKSQNGPQRSLKGIKEGDIIFFKSKEKAVCAVGKVVNAKSGSKTGWIAIDFKVAE